MALTSSLHTMSSSTNGYHLQKANTTITDNQLVDILLHGQTIEHKIQIVNRWCKVPRRHRLNSIIDVSQRYDTLLSLVNILQNTSNTEYQFNFLTLISELQGNISHYDQQIYVPAMLQCLSSSSTDVQSLTGEVLVRHIHSCSDVSTFLYILNRDGLKSTNVRICVKSIELLPLILNGSHKNENLSPIFEVLLELCQDSQFRLNYREILIRSIEHLRRILNNEMISNYLENYSNSLRRIYSNYVLPQIQNQIDENDETLRASGTDFIETAPNFDSTEIKLLMESIRSNWSSFDDNDRIQKLNQLKSSCDQFYHSLQQFYTNKSERNFHRFLEPCLIGLFELLQSLTSKNIDLSIKVKLILFTCLGWLIKYSSSSFSRKNRKSLSTIFKNILIFGSSNNRQLAKFAVSLVLLFGNFVHPQLILQDLIDEQFLSYNYRVQLELLAIVTATLIRFRNNSYDDLINLCQYIFPMLISNRRELRHGAMECFTVVCSYFNGYQPVTSSTLENNASIRILLNDVERLSNEASFALRFRFQRNLLPALTEEGNITPGLVFSATSPNDPDVQFILSVGKKPSSTPQSLQSMDTMVSETDSLVKFPSTNTKLLQLAMPFVTNKSILRTREIQPVKTSEIELDSHRLINNNNQEMPSIHPIIQTNGSSADLTVTGNNNYRALTVTERNLTEDWSKKPSNKNQTRKDNQTFDQHQETTPLQFRPLIPRRTSPGRFPAAHNLLLTSQIHNYQEQKHNENEQNHDQIPIAVTDSRSVSIYSLEKPSTENNQQSGRSVHSSLTRKKADRIFNPVNENEPSLSSRTLTPEQNNESGIHSQFERENQQETNKSSNIKATLFNTKPRLARSGSKQTINKTPTNENLHQNQEQTSSNVKVVGRGYMDEKKNTEEKFLPVNNKTKPKIIKGSNFSNPGLSTTQNISFNDNEFTHDDEHDIGVVGKAVQPPLRTKTESEVLRTTTSKNEEILDIVSDEFDSDSKENETFTDVNQSLSASFRLRIQQKTQEKIEEKERRRHDREVRRQQEQMNSNLSDTPMSSNSNSRYSSQPDLSSLTNESLPTAKRNIDPNSTILPNVPTQIRTRLTKNSMARSQTFNNRRDLSGSEPKIGFQRPLSEDRITDQLRNPQSAFREAMQSISSDDWEMKCAGLTTIQALLAQHPDMITLNLHQVVLTLINEVKNLRSQVARIALLTFCDMFKYLQKNMDIELDITTKALIQKSADSNDFLKLDTDKCLQMMVENVSPQKALQALIAGGASHRNPAARKTTAKYIYFLCEKLGPTKILNGNRDMTERILQVAANFALDGPPEIRWYGKKIYHMLMNFDELDTLMKHHLNATLYTNMCEILDNIRAKGGVGETPIESARNNNRRALSNERFNGNGTLAHQFSSMRKINTADQTEQVREILKQLRSSDFRDRLNGIEEFQKLCELETETAIQSVQLIFDGFNECLSNMNSKVVLKALNTMHQIIPILSDNLSPVINSALPLIAQNIASNNREIAQLASDIIDTAIEYIDCGMLIQPLCILSQNSNLRVRPEIVLKLAVLAPQVYQRRPKQAEIHLFPTFWKLLNGLRGQNSTAFSSSAGGSNSLNASIQQLTRALYIELGDGLIERASASSSVPPGNLQLLRELCANIQVV